MDCLHDGFEQEIVRGMSLAFFASAYVAQATETGVSLQGLSQGEVLNHLPEPIE